MKTAFVLSGGGARGAFQVGAMKAIIEAGILPDACYGTNLGALNAGMLAFQSIFTIETFWRSIRNAGDIFSGQGLGIFSQGGFYSSDPLRKIIEKYVEGTPTREAMACVCDLYTGSKEYAYRSKLALTDFQQYVLASASIPVAVNPVADRYVDGGVREETPLKPAIDDGADRIIVFLTSPYVVNPTPETSINSPKLLNNGLRALSMLEHQIFLNDIATCLMKNDLPQCKPIELLVISPDTFLYDAMDFDPKVIGPAIDAGFQQGQFLLAGSGMKT